MIGQLEQNNHKRSDLLKIKNVYMRKEFLLLIKIILFDLILTYKEIPIK